MINKEMIINKQNFDDMVKYHNQMGGYTFENTIGDINLTIECHHRDGNKIEVYNYKKDLWENYSFNFNNLIFEKFEGYILELIEKVK